MCRGSMQVEGEGSRAGVHVYGQSLKVWACSPPSVDRIWLRVYQNKIPIYPIFYLLRGDYNKFL